VTVRRLFCLVVSALFAAPFVHSAGRQSTDTEAGFVFEVASVRPNTSSVPMRISSQGATFRAVNVTLKQLVTAATAVPDDRILGGPGWVDSDRFDIVARAPADETGPRFQMLRALLAERFILEMYEDFRSVPAYDLVMARSDGVLGPNLRRSAIDCDNPDVRAKYPVPRPDSGLPGCGIIQMPGRILAGGVALIRIVGFLGTGRPVVDRTGLTGTFDIDLEWSPRPELEGISIFTALQEQLGLKLESSETAVRFVTIEHAERPEPN
jgi:uncharacterized protein (TIGR03435 family)